MTEPFDLDCTATTDIAVGIIVVFLVGWQIQSDFENEMETLQQPSHLLFQPLINIEGRRGFYVTPVIRFVVPAS